MTRAHLSVGQRLLEFDESLMANNKPSVSADRLRGWVKEAIGKLTGDARTEAQGKGQKPNPRPPRSGESGRRSREDG